MSHVLDWCDQQDKYSKGVSPTTKAVRDAYAKDVQDLLVDYTRWLFDRKGIHDQDRRFLDHVPEFLTERGI